MSLAEALNVVQNKVDKLKKSGRRKTFRDLEQESVREQHELQIQIEEANREIESLDEAYRTGKAANIKKVNEMSLCQSKIDQISAQLDAIHVEMQQDEDKLASFAERKLWAKSGPSKKDIAASEDAKAVLRAICHLTGVRWNWKAGTVSGGYCFNGATNRIKLFNIDGCSRERAIEKVWAAIKSTTALPIEQ